MKNIKGILNNLRLIEKKYALYFRDKDFNIRDCFYFNLEPPVSIHLKSNMLPFEIANEIEEVLWVEADRFELLNTLLVDINTHIEKCRELNAERQRLWDSIQKSNKRRLNLVQGLFD